MYKVTMTSKGQIIIPSRIRKRLNLKKGTKLNMEDDGVNIIIKPETGDYIKSLEGAFGRGGKITDYLLEEHRIQRLKEDKKWKR
ncbi:MAG: AbrB/MazE/SpoVT family DNA-binding domain-containing protein [Candidatus Goldiibacteriota bacterium]